MSIIRFIGVAAKHTLIVLLVMFVAALLFARSCCPTPQPEDVEHMRMLKEKFPEYDFSFDCEYVRTRAKTVEAQGNENKLQEMYLLFFIDKSGVRRNSDFVYLNYYGTDGEFKYQVYYNVKTKSFSKGLREHH
ncbi:hypothetical protein JCM15519_22620 [Fundidesulfovibrio butyratiphilus]